MIEVTRYITSDGKMHKTFTAAERHSLDRACVELTEILRDANCGIESYKIAQTIVHESTKNDRPAELFNRLHNVVQNIKDSLTIEGSEK